MTAPTDSVGSACKRRGRVPEIRNYGGEKQKNLRLEQKRAKKFMKKHKKGLDIHGCVYYHRRVRAKGTALREHCDDAGDCVEKR